MAPPVIQRWTSIIERGRTDDLDVPLVSPQREKAAAKAFGDTDFHYGDVRVVAAVGPWQIDRPD